MGKKKNKSKFISYEEVLDDIDEKIGENHFDDKIRNLSSLICQHKKTALFTIGKTAIYADALCDLAPVNYSLILDCAGLLRFSDSSPDFIPTVSIPWPDFGIPFVKMKFWVNFVSHLPTGNVGIGCYGGHGRTGTALAAILIAAKKWEPEQAITFLRKNYCNRAVESMNQIEYLIAFYKFCSNP